jgi:glutathione-regulated potassium-efflux system ancillary protein KefF
MWPEQAAYHGVDRVVFIYPTHWFNLTPMLKGYLNEVWQYGWAFGAGGDALKGKDLMVVTSAGASPFTYSREGLIQSSMDEVLSPMKASALYVGMNWLPPLAFYEVAAANRDKVPEFQQALAQALHVA